MYQFFIEVALLIYVGSFAFVSSSSFIAFVLLVKVNSNGGIARADVGEVDQISDGLEGVSPSAMEGGEAPASWNVLASGDD